MPDTDLGDGWMQRDLPEGGYTYPASEVPLPRSKPLTLTDVAPQQGTISTIIDNLLGLNGHNRYQTWPEKMLRNVITAPHDAVNRNKPTADPDLKSELELKDEHLDDLKSGKLVHVSGHMLVPVSFDPFAEEQNAA